jgi:hypothetical protein
MVPAGAGILALAVLFTVPVRTLAAPRRSGLQSQPASPASQQTQAARPVTAGRMAAVKPDPEKAREAFQRGYEAEQKGEWQAAYDAYSDAFAWAPDNRDILLKREFAKSRLVQTKMDKAEREAISGRLPEARRELLAARYLDPTNTVVRDRLVELTALEPSLREQKPVEYELAGPVRLEHQAGKKSFNYRGNTQGAYDEVARQYGVEVAFDADLHMRPVHLVTNQEDFATTLRILGTMTGTFWRPLTKRLFFVSDDTAQKRKDFASVLVRTVLLPAASTQDQMTEMLRLVREVAGITRSDLDVRSRTLTMRASPQAIAVATDVIENLEKPVGEMVLEVEILDTNITRAQDLGITPPQTGKIFTLSKQEIQEAESGVQGLLNVIEELFGTPSALSGLSTTEVTSLLGTGQVGLGSLIPPLITIGGGNSIFLATLSGGAANYSQLLNVVRDGRRILLRAEDGKPATFFVGERFPVTLAQFSPSLAGTGANIPGVASINFPTTDLTTGNAPDFVATASLRNNGIADLVVTNHNDNTLSVFLGNGDGTFAAPALVTLAAGNTGPVWIATGVFDTTNKNTNIDLAVANQTSNTLSVLAGKGDGTFPTESDLQTGAAPVSVAAALFNNTTGAPVNLFVANHGDNTVTIFAGNNDGTFKALTTLLHTGIGPSSIATGDFNGDGNTDLAVTNESDNTVSIFLGNGDGTFQPRVDDAVGNGPVWVSAADLNGDGILDLAIANDGAPTDTNTGNTVTVLLGNASTTNTAVGNGTFSPGTIRDFPAGNGPTSIAVGDFNVDGLQDLVVADSTDNAISLLLGLGGGVFGPNFELNVGTDPVSIVSADFNADGTPDVAVANEGSNTVSVILDSTTFGGSSNGLSASPFPGVEYLDIGVKIKATPRIHLNDEVSLQLHFEVTSLASESFNGIPVIANQEVEQTVRLKTGETTMVAGFLQRQRIFDINGLPFVADVPVAGALGSDQKAQDADTEVLILITPRMMTLAPRKDHEFYAGRGALEGPGGVGPARGEREVVPPDNRLPSAQPPPQPLVQPPPGQPPAQQPPPQEPPANNPPQPNPAPETPPPSPQ